MTYPGSGWPEQPPPAPYGPPAYGQPPYPYGPPQFQFGPPQYAAPPPPSTPPLSGSRWSIGLVISLAIVLIAVVGVVIAASVHQNSNSASATPNLLAPSAVPSTAPNLAPSTASPSGAAPNGPTEAAARAVAERYMADVNAQNKVDALTLICDEVKVDYQRSLQTTSSDFAYTWAVTGYRGVDHPDPDTTEVTYDVTLTRVSATTPHAITVTFGVVQENGAKLCSEDSN